MIGLLGVSFAGWTNVNRLVATITTGTINYNFLESETRLFVIKGGSYVNVPALFAVEDGKSLRIDIRNPEAILNMTYDDILRIHYMLDEIEDGNVPLKAKDEDFGLISIDLKAETIKWNYADTDIDIDKYTYLIPKSLGLFRVQHHFDGKVGIIDFFPVSLPEKIVDTIIYDYSNETKPGNVTGGSIENNSAEITEDISFDYKTFQEDIEMLQNDVMQNKNQIEQNDDKNNKNGELNNNEDDRKLQITRRTISFSAEYSFVIPIGLDQFNVSLR